MLSILANHLWQSTVFAVAAGLLTLLLKTNHARTRHWLWLAASLKFLIPFSLLVGIGNQIEWRAPQPAIPVVLEQLSQPFPSTVSRAPSAVARNSNLAPACIFTFWLCGSFAVLVSWTRRWRRVRAALSLAHPIRLPAPIPIRSSPALLEPGVFGIFRPVLLLPEGIADRLTPAQLDAVIAHELCHVRRRDNLTSLVHMFVEAAFWFHPLVWWIGARLVDERERACDEDVLRQGSQPQVYAESIIKVCQFYFESPIACVSGITGSNLAQRIEAIMTHRAAARLDFARKLLLTALAIAAVAGPIAIGLLHTPAGRAQSPDKDATRLEFEVASIKPSKSGGRGFSMDSPPGWTASNASLRNLIESAYSVKDHQISGEPKWWDEDRFDIVAKCPPESNAVSLRRLRSLLEDRFKLTFHWETKTMQGYALVVSKTGSKLQPAKADEKGHSSTQGGRGSISGKNVTLAHLADSLSRRLDRPVADMTGIAGVYDFKLEWTPGESQPGIKPGERGEDLARTEFSDGPTIFTALQEQLGLKLEARKVPTPILVIDALARTPTEN